MSYALKASALAALATTVLGHGHVSGIVADDTYYQGFSLDYYYAMQNKAEVPTHYGWYAEDLDNGFISPDNYTGSDIICHKNASPTNVSTATVAAGGKVDFQWTAWPDSHIGPVITYVAKCDADCADADKTTLKWVKIDASGYDTSTSTWASVAMIATNNTWTTTVPTGLAAGNYVFRNEIIALHGAESENGAQNYPQCLNIAITGDGTDEPEGTLGTELYTPTDAGILFNPYTTIISYDIPGPTLYAGASSGSGSSGSGSSAAASSAVATATSAPASSTVASSSAVATSAAATSSAVAADVTGSAAAPTSTGSASSSTLPESFTLDTFISWLKEAAGSSSSSKARRHARQF